MPKQKSDFKKIIEESSTLINKLKSYEERIKEFDQSITFLKSKSTLAKIKKQIDNKDSIIGELAEAKLQLGEELKEKNKLIKALRAQIQSTDKEKENEESKLFLLNQNLEKQTQIINEKDVKIKQLTTNLQTLKMELNSTKNSITQLTNEFESKSSSLAEADENLNKISEQIRQLKQDTESLKNKIREKDRAVLKFKEKAYILDSTTQEMAIKNNELQDEILILNQKISKKNDLIRELNKEIDEKNTYYPALIKVAKQDCKDILNKTLKQNMRKELELKTRINELENKLTIQKQQLFTKSQKERHIIEELKSKLSELGEFEEKKTRKK